MKKHAVMVFLLTLAGSAVFVALILYFSPVSEKDNSKPLLGGDDTNRASKIVDRVAHDDVHIGENGPVVVHVDLSGLKNTVEGK